MGMRVRVPKRSQPAWQVGGGAVMPVVGAQVQLVGRKDEEYTDQELRDSAFKVRGGPPSPEEMRKWRALNARALRGTVTKVNEAAGTARVLLDEWIGPTTCCWGELLPLNE